MNQLIERVDMCSESRGRSAGIAAEVLSNSSGASESDVRDNLRQAMSVQPQFLQSGWYPPPPSGIGVLFASPSDASRLQFDSLRNEKFWPKPENILNRETVGLVYLSPVHKQSGVIGDFGFTFYQGENAEVQEHLNRCLNAIEIAAEHAEAGMEFRELHKFAQKIFSENGLTSGIVARHDPSGNNFGHTIPWSHDIPTDDELEIIKEGDMNTLKKTIGNKRLYINGVETFKIPKTIAFTVESRLTSINTPSMPDTFFHVIVTFKGGKRRIISNYNPVFKKLGMKYIRSRF